MIEPTPLPDGNIFAVSDRLMLFSSMESVAIAGFMLGREGAELALHITLEGRINRSTERTDITFALSPEDSLQLVEMILHSLDPKHSSRTAERASKCPECREGKCRNCDGTTWSNELDSLQPCTCTHPDGKQ